MKYHKRVHIANMDTFAMLQSRCFGAAEMPIFETTSVYMAIIVNLDLLLVKKKMRSKELAEAVGITEQNLSVLKTGKAKALRFSTLEAICKALSCQPGDLLEFQEEDPSHLP